MLIVYYCYEVIIMQTSQTVSKIKEGTKQCIRLQHQHHRVWCLCLEQTTFNGRVHLV